MPFYPLFQYQNKVDPLQPIVSFSWFESFSEPIVKSKIGLAASDQQFIAHTSTPSPFVATGWYRNLEEPVRIKPQLHSSRHPFLFLYPAPSPFVATDWRAWLSEPVRIRLLLQPDDQPFIFEQLPQPVFLEWFASLSEPVRLKPRLMIGLQEFLERISFIPISFTARMNAQEQGDIFLSVLYQFNRARRALVSIFKK
jgi:hypothetical protein